MTALSNEYQVLVQAAAPGETTAERGPTPAYDNVRWEHLESLAEWHRLGPLLWRHLAGRHGVPAGVADRLHSAYAENAARSLYLRAELDQVLGALDAADVRAMVLKGAALVETVFPDPALRPMRDLDILVPAGDAGRAQCAVKALGYRPVAPFDGADGEAWMAEHYHHRPPLVRGDGLLAVELHHHLVPAFDPGHFDLSGFWARARPAPAGPSHLLPAPEDLLLHVCLHSSRNRLWRSAGALGQLGDIAWIAARLEVDWSALVDNARNYGVGPSVFLALFAATELVGAAVPGAALRDLRPDSFRPEHGRAYIEGRVLRRRTWVLLEYLAWGRPPPMQPVPDRVRRGDPDGSLEATLRARARRLVNGARMAGPSLARPCELAHELWLNHWIRSLEPRA